MIAAAVVGAEWGWDAAMHAGIPIVSMNDVLDSQGRLRTKYLFFLNWSQMIDVGVTYLYECVNFHCTPLPYGRGGHPIEHMILNGHKETVITAHQVTSEIDAGPIYGTRGPVSLAGSKAAIHARFVRPAAELMKWIAATHPEPKPQVGEAVLFKRLPPDEYRAFWSARG